MKRGTVVAAAAFGLMTAVLSSASANAAPVAIPFLPTWDTRDQTIGIGNDFSPDWIATVSGTVYVTDLDVIGDNYNIYVNSGLVATTAAADCSTYGAGACDTGVANPLYYADPWAAFASGLFATAVFKVNAGDIVDIQAIALPTGFSDSTVAITETVPEPATWAMMMIGLAGLGYASWRTSRRKTAAIA